MTLFLIRHGETAWNVEGRMQGRRDSPLTARGEAQARRIGQIAAAERLAALPCLCSPAGRAMRTARLAGLAPQPTPDLAEVGMGAWEGRLRAEITEVPGVEWKFAAPGGEGEAAFRARLDRVLAAAPRPAVLVTHGMVLIGLRMAARGLGPDAWDALDDPQGVVFRLDGAGETVLR